MHDQFDVIVIGAGLGGLLSAAQFAGRHQRVAVVERLAHVGGRFTAKTFQGAQVSTGAVHMLPFGSNGVLAAMLRELGVPHGVHDAEVFGSFHIRGQQLRARSVLAVLHVLGRRQYARFVRLGAQMFLRAPRADECDLTFQAWLVRQGVTMATYPDLVLFFARMSHFALSIDLDQVTYPEVCATMKNMFRYGPPGIVDGGCAAVAGALEARLRTAGVALLLNHDVPQILTSDGAATGVLARDRATGDEITLHAPLIISNIGPQATAAAVSGASPQTEPDGTPLPLATGLKVHVLTRRPIIDHQGIMYCLDTERIAGVVQPSNSDRRLAPPGEHLLITHQLWRPERESIAQARTHALADLTRLLGPQELGAWRVLTISQYHDAWPVNRAAQGADAIPQTAVRGLYQVGDAVKPSGYLMVEGVAQSVNALLDAVERALPDLARPSVTHIAPKPPRRRALAWLVAPPAAHPANRTAAPEKMPI
jgi:phytoene dehydrogenase-like protein